MYYFSIETLTENKLNEMRETVRPFGFELISKSYMGVNEKYIWKCERRHEFLCDWHQMARSGKPYCGECYNEDRLGVLKNNVEKHGCKLLSKVYKNYVCKYSIECKNGHVSEVSVKQMADEVFNCQKCKKEFMIKKMNYLAKRCNGECLSTEFKTMDDEYEWKCSKEHFFKNTFTKIQRRVCFCQTCRDEYEDYGFEVYKTSTCKVIFPDI
jgi:hypothetical protein